MIKVSNPEELAAKTSQRLNFDGVFEGRL